MSRRVSLVVALVVACLALSGLVATPPSTAAKAGKDVATVKDKAGDAPAGIDLLSGKYAMSRKQAVFKVKLKRLTQRTFLAFEIWPLTSAWDRIAVYRENGKTVGKVYFVDNEEGPVPYLKKCPGLKIKWKQAKRTVKAVVPGGCLQAAQPNAAPYQFRVFSRFGGDPNTKRDKMPKVTLDYH